MLFLTGKVVEVLTGYGKAYQEFWMATSHTTGITFQMKASPCARIILSPGVGSPDDEVLDICIGAYDNTYITIKQGIDGAIVKEEPAPYILDQYNYKWFWVTWVNNIIQVRLFIILLFNIVA